MSTRLVIIGAGGFGRGVATWLARSPQYCFEHEVSEVVFVDDSAVVTDTGQLVLGPLHDYVPRDEDRVLIAVGNPALRRRMADSLTTRGARFATFVADEAVVPPGFSPGIGSIICPTAVIEIGARLGMHVHVNLQAAVCHDTVVGDFTTVSPQANLMGEIMVGHSVFVGGSAAVMPRITIGDNVLIGAGAVVTKSVVPGATLVGNPARPLGIQP